MNMFQAILIIIQKKTIIFYDINNDKEIKRINNTHEKQIYIVKHYEYNLYIIYMILF